MLDGWAWCGLFSPCFDLAGNHLSGGSKLSSKPMSGDEAFFVARRGAIWACFLDGKPAVQLGSEDEFWKAVTAFYDERNPPNNKPQPNAAPSSAPMVPQASSPTKTPVSPPVLREVNERADPRHSVVIVGKVFTQGGSREAIVADLSSTGCRFDDYSGRGVTQGMHLTIKIGTVGPLPGIVRWVDGTSVGVQFDAALHPSVLEHIRLQFARPG